MLSGAVQGRRLTMLVEISKAKRILEIGAFTGYSATCMAYGLPEDGHIDTLEINDELEDLMREGWSRAGVADKITLHIGDARETLSTLEGPYDIVYMDANKREYVTYYESGLRSCEARRPDPGRRCPLGRHSGRIPSRKTSRPKASSPSMTS